MTFPDSAPFLPLQMVHHSLYPSFALVLHFPSVDCEIRRDLVRRAFEHSRCPCQGAREILKLGSHFENLQMEGKHSLNWRTQEMVGHLRMVEVRCCFSVEVFDHY
jgi:hypothetical protein